MELGCARSDAQRVRSRSRTGEVNTKDSEYYKLAMIIINECKCEPSNKKERR